MEEHSGTGFLSLLLVVFLAFLVPLLLSRFKRVPVVVGEIVAGVIIGGSGLNLVEANPTLVVLSDIGLAFLMFLAGMEIDFSKLFPPREKEEPRSGPNLPGWAFIVYLMTLANYGIQDKVLEKTLIQKLLRITKLKDNILIK